MLNDFFAIYCIILYYIILYYIILYFIILVFNNYSFERIPVLEAHGFSDWTAPFQKWTTDCANWPANWPAKIKKNDYNSDSFVYAIKFKNPKKKKLKKKILHQGYQSHPRIVLNSLAVPSTMENEKPI